MKAHSYLIYIVLFLLSFCKSKSLEKQSKTYKPNNHISQVDSSQFKKIDYEYVKSKSLPSAAVYDIENIDLEKLKKIDTIFFKDLTGLPIYYNQISGDTIKFDRYEDWYFYDAFQVGKFNVFSIIQRDEVCCHSMFFMVCDKMNRLISANYIGLTGGDGNWGGSDIIRKGSENNFQVKGKSSIEEGVYDKKNKYLNMRKEETEYYTVNLKLNKHGFFMGDTIAKFKKIVPVLDNNH